MAQVVIVGGGIAGLSCAYFLAQRGVRDVLVLEREDTPGFHATGRSASVVHKADGDELVQQLKLLGGRWLRTPPAGFCDHELVDDAGSLCLYDQTWPQVEARVPRMVAQGLPLEILTPAQAAARVPLLEPSAFAGALFDGDDGNIDVHALLDGFVRGARAGGAVLRCGVEVSAIVTDGGRCTGVTTSDGTIETRWVVNAAGAWAGVVAGLAGASLIEIRPYRRCAVTFRAPAEVELRGWPLVVSDEHHVYFKPESGRILMSPMDEGDAEPGDARPDDETIAAGFERLAIIAPRAVPRAIERKWAGLRTFAPDRVPVVGEDPRLRGFFWLAGQGGYGIETSPILGAIAADLIVDGATARFDAAPLSPTRFTSLP